MNDAGLIALKHSRIMIPLILAIFALSTVRLFSDASLIQQVHLIGTMLLFVGLTVYALNEVVDLIGMCKDRLLLMSPKSRLSIASIDCAVLGGFLLLAYAASNLLTIKNAIHTHTELQPLLTGFAHYAISLFTGLGLILLVTYLFKWIGKGMTLRCVVWLSFLIVIALLVAGYIYSLQFKYGSEVIDHLVIGVQSEAKEIVNIYAAILPITFWDIKNVNTASFTMALINLGCGVIFWGANYMLSKRHANYIEI